MKDKNRVNITNILLFVISILVGIVGYFYVKGEVSDGEFKTEVKESIKDLSSKMDTMVYQNTVEHIALFGSQNTHIEKASLVWEDQIKPFLGKVQEIEKYNNEQDLLIRENTMRSRENSRLLRQYNYFKQVSDSVNYWMYGLK